jgi:hypothetical protein
VCITRLHTFGMQVYCIHGREVVTNQSFMAIQILTKQKKLTKRQRDGLVDYLYGRITKTEVAKVFNIDHQRIDSMVEFITRRAVQDGRTDVELLLLKH